MGRRSPILGGLATVLLCIAALVAPRPAPAQTTVTPQHPATPLAAADAQRTFTVLLQRFFEAYVRKDIEAMAACWHAGGPARHRRNVVLVEFDLRQVELDALTVRNAAADAGGGRARAILELKVTDTKTGRARRERRIRDFTFLPDEGGTWKIWNEVSPAGELARRLLATPAAERDGIIAADPEIASDDTLAGLSLEAGRLQAQQRHADVLDALATLARLARALGDQDSLGHGLIQAGSLNMLLGSYPEAAEAFASARAAFEATGNAAEVAACDANLGNMSYIQGRFEEAATRYRQALEVFERLNDDARMASAFHGLGNALYMQTEFARALEHYTRAVTILRRTGDKRGESAALQAIAMVDKELGDYAAAIDAWRASLALTEAGGDVAGTAKAWSGMGEIFRLQGDLVRAVEHHLRSLRLWEQLGNAGACAASRFAIGQVYALQRNFPRALEFYQKALELDQSITGDVAMSESGQARDLGGLGGAHFAQGQPDVALGEYERSLVLREKGRDEAAVMWTLVHIGVLHASQHRAEDAGRVYARALALADAGEDLNASSTILALRSQLEFETESPDAALASAARAADIALSVDHFDTVAFARLVTGRVHQKAGRVTEARTAYEDAIAQFARVPIGPAAETFFDNRRAPHVALVDLLAGQGDLAAAFLASERGRQQDLADVFGGDGSVVVKGLTAEERDLERSIAKDLRTLAVKMRRERGRQKPDASRLTALQAETALRQSERDALRKKMYGAHPLLRDLRAQAEPAGPEAAAVLDGSASLLSYVVGESRTWVFAVARGGSTGPWAVQKAAAIDVKSSDLAGQVRRYREAIAKKEGGAADLSRELHTLLVEPVEAALARHTRLVVVPDSFLWSLPFEALQTSGGRFIVEDAAVSYAPSLTALAVAGRAAADAASRSTLVAFGRPAQDPAVEERLALARPAPATAAQPASDREVRTIAAYYGPARSKTFLGDQARADRLAQGVARGAALHLAVPTVLTEATPLYSLLAFTPSTPADVATGLVEVAALMSWNLPADVAVASHVEYGPAAGEGEALTALAWSLLVAGTPTLVLNRWLGGVADPSIGIRFHRAYSGSPGARPRRPRAAESLQTAMKGVLAQPATRHPFYWAGFMVIGR